MHISQDGLFNVCENDGGPYNNELNVIPLNVSYVCMDRFNNRCHIATVPACSSGILTNVLPYRNVMPQTSPPCHSIRGRPVAVLSIDVERHNGIHSYPF